MNNPESDKEELTEFLSSEDERNQGDVEDNDDIKVGPKRGVSHPRTTSMAQTMSSDVTELKEEQGGAQRKRGGAFSFWDSSDEEEDEKTMWAKPVRKVNEDEK